MMARRSPLVHCSQLAYYCCKEHQLLDRKRHKDACKAALAAQEL